MSEQKPPNKIIEMLLVPNDPADDPAITSAIEAAARATSAEAGSPPVKIDGKMSQASDGGNDASTEASANAVPDQGAIPIDAVRDTVAEGKVLDAAKKSCEAVNGGDWPKELTPAKTRTGLRRAWCGTLQLVGKSKTALTQTLEDISHDKDLTQNKNIVALVLCISCRFVYRLKRVLVVAGGGDSDQDDDQKGQSP